MSGTPLGPTPAHKRRQGPGTWPGPCRTMRAQSAVVSCGEAELGRHRVAPVVSQGDEVGPGGQRHLQVGVGTTPLPLRRVIHRLHAAVLAEDAQQRVALGGDGVEDDAGVLLEVQRRQPVLVLSQVDGEGVPRLDQLRLADRDGEVALGGAPVGPDGDLVLPRRQLRAERRVEGVGVPVVEELPTVVVLGREAVGAGDLDHQVVRREALGIGDDVDHHEGRLVEAQGARPGVVPGHRDGELLAQDDLPALEVSALRLRRRGLLVGRLRGGLRLRRRGGGVGCRLHWRRRGRRLVIPAAQQQDQCPDHCTEQNHGGNDDPDGQALAGTAALPARAAGALRGAVRGTLTVGLLAGRVGLLPRAVRLAVALLAGTVRLLVATELSGRRRLGGVGRRTWLRAPVGVAVLAVAGRRVPAGLLGELLRGLVARQLLGGIGSGRLVAGTLLSGELLGGLLARRLVAGTLLSGELLGGLLARRLVAGTLLSGELLRGLLGRLLRARLRRGLLGSSPVLVSAAGLVGLRCRRLSLELFSALLTDRLLGALLRRGDVLGPTVAGPVADPGGVT